MTSYNDKKPLKIDQIELPGKYTLGMSFCLGHCGRKDLGFWNLNKDLKAVINWGATYFLTLMKHDEFEKIKIKNFFEIISKMPFIFYHFPITDCSFPTKMIDLEIRNFEKNYLINFKRNEKIFVHCRGGLGRTGVIVSRFLINLGYKPKEAINLVRKIRPGAIENSKQENYVLNFNK